MSKIYTVPKPFGRNIQFFGSNMRCKVCNGWGGEFGDARGVGAMCSSCYFKKYGTYD